MKMMFTYNLLRRPHEIVAHQAVCRPAVLQIVLPFPIRMPHKPMIGKGAFSRKPCSHRRLPSGVLPQQIFCFALKRLRCYPSMCKKQIPNFNDCSRNIQRQKDYVSFRTGQTCQTSKIGLQSVVIFSWYDSALMGARLRCIRTAVKAFSHCR